MSRFIAIIGAVCLLVPHAATTSRPGSKKPGIEELSRAPLDPSVPTGPRGGATPVYRLSETGFPALSEAGYVQLADEGATFYYAARTEDRIDSNRKRGILDTNNFGDAEAMGHVGRIVAAWHRLHPDIRIGIDEISGRYGGFPDYDGDGVSDHLTHQLGTNVNLSVPCRLRPEKTIHLGVSNEDLFDRKLFAELVDLLTESGVHEMTSNRALLATGAAELPLASRLPWTVSTRQGDYSVVYRNQGSPAMLQLLNPRGDHADHVNALMCRPE